MFPNIKPKLWLKKTKDILQLKFFIISYVNSLEQGNTSMFDFLPSWKEFNVDPPNAKHSNSFH